MRCAATGIDVTAVNDDVVRYGRDVRKCVPTRVRWLTMCSMKERYAMMYSVVTAMCDVDQDVSAIGYDVFSCSCNEQQCV